MRKVIILLSLTILTSTQLFAQTTTNDSINAARIAEVYGPTFETDWPVLHAQLMDMLSNRVSYMEEVVSMDEKYPLLTSLPLMNKYNPLIQPHDPATFDVAVFNPLTYTWNFFDDNIQVYRIDGTNYLLIVQPQ